MCGIAGFFGKKNINNEVINKTLYIMKNRGPDFSNYFKKKFSNNTSVYLLHSRLSIIDLHQRSNQPFIIGDYILIFNGEIYNYLELKKNLESKGIFLKTNSDTEVLLHYYIIYGEKCVEHFDGMWSFAIFNKRNRNLFISRDRFAEKPLYYFVNKEGIFFGSEIKFIKSLAEKQFDVNKKNINKFLSFGPRSIFKDNETFYNNIKLLQYSENLNCDGNLKIVNKKYWSPKPKFKNKINLHDAVSLARDLLIKSLRLRMRSDVPTAFCLSGGVDSAGLASIATKILNLKIKTYSIIDSDERYNEENNIKKVVSDLGCESEIIKISKKDFIPNLKKLAEYHDSPVFTLSQYLHSSLMQSIKKGGYKVVISGNAADELFSGYYEHHLLHLKFLKNSKNYKINLKSWKTFIKNKIRNKVFKNDKLFIDNPNYRAHIYDNSEILGKYLETPEKFNFKEKKFSNDLFSNRRLNELFYEVVPPILNNEDLNSMMNSVENRAPYLSKELFEFCFSLSPGVLIKNAYTKYILREALKGILKDEIRLDRQKKGFNCSIKTLINFKDKNIINYMLNKDSEIFEYVNKDEFTKIFKKNLDENYLSKFIFAFLSTKIFLDKKNI